MRTPLLLVGLLLAVGVSAALAQRSGSTTVVQLGQSVHLAHSDIYCRTGRVKGPAAWPYISCYETRNGLRGSYEVAITEHDIWVEQHVQPGVARIVFSRSQHWPPL